MAVVLFDIDNTLLYTGGRGGEALTAAFVELYGRNLMQGVEVSGKTDPLIIDEAIQTHLRRPAEKEEIDRLIALYLEHFSVKAKDTTGGHVKPGVAGMLARLANGGGYHTGLLTGNVEDGARIKLETFKLAQFFSFGAYGSDHPSRDRLLPFALKRLSALLKREIPPGPHVVVIGDTVRDVDCAKPYGARTIAVATGWYDENHLAGAEPDLVVGDLERGEKEVWRLFEEARADFAKLKP